MKTFFRRLMAWLLEPSQAVQDDIQRSRATIAAGIALVVCVFALINAYLFSPEYWGESYHWWEDAETIAAVVGGLVMIIPYVLARTRYYKIAMWLLVIIPTAGPFIQNIEVVMRGASLDSYTFYFVILSPLFAMIFFNAREVFWVGSATLLCLTTWYAYFQENVLQYGATDAFFYALLICPIIIFAAYYWSRLEGKRRIQLEELLEASQRHQAEAEQANALKTEFLAIVSHELRTPLNSIIGYSDLMLKGIGVQGPPLTGDSLHLTGRIKHNGKHLLHLINDILDMSKIEAQHMTVSNEPFSPRLLLRWLETEMEPFAAEKKLALECTLTPDLPHTLIGDENLLRRILINLTSNAIKFTKQGSVRVALASAPQGWSIRVSDTGIGIPPEMRDTIFQAFRQVDGSFQRHQGGTGLGLTICRNLAHLMGGTISVESEIGKGSTFTVTLPQVQEAAQIDYELEGSVL